MSPGVVTLIGLAAILIGGFAYVARTVVENRTRRHLVDQGLTADEIRTLFTQPPPPTHGSLRAGLVLLAVGGALIFAQYLPYGTHDPFVYGLVLVAGACGLLLYVWFTARLGSRDRER
ncbi:MAG: hypothetical protein ACODAA_06315 [Gemmatimonadota bacterium]